MLQNYNFKHRNVNFTQKEESGSLNSLDILISRLDKKFTVSAYHKSTLSRGVLQFSVSLQTIRELVSCLPFGTFSIVSN